MHTTPTRKRLIAAIYLIYCVNNENQFFIDNQGLMHYLLNIIKVPGDIKAALQARFFCMSSYSAPDIIRRYYYDRYMRECMGEAGEC